MSFPRLKESGGFQLLRGLPNSRAMEVLSMAVHTSPSLLKQCVGNARTYIHPIQRDLDLTPIEGAPDGVSKLISLFVHLPKKSHILYPLK